MLLVGVSDPVGIRTRDPQLRRLLLYPAELPDPSRYATRMCTSARQITRVCTLISAYKAIWAQRYYFFLTCARQIEKNYKSDSKSSCNLVLFIAPTVRCTISPSLKNKIVGIFIIP